MTDPAPVRCAWCVGDPLMEAYHDAEWGVLVRDARMLWEMLILEGFRAAFDQFDPEKVARYDAAKVEALMQDPGIIRARAKIEATIGNARAYLAMQAGGEDFAEWAWAQVGGAVRKNDGVHVPAKTPVSEALSKALKAKGFKFVGATIAYAWMEAVGMVNDHAPHCFRRDQV